MSLSDDDDPLWKRILFNEMLLATVAILIILLVAFMLATGKEDVDEYGRPIKAPPASQK